MRQVLLPIWNAWYFFTLYANAAGTTGAGAHRLDRRARPLHPGQDPRPRRRRHRGDGRLRPVRRLRRGARASSTRSPTGTSAAAASGSGPATHDAIDTLHTVLARARAGSPRRCCRSSTEAIYRGLTGERSVHLTDWPDAADAARRRRPGRGDGPRSATCARRRCRCARPTAGGCASRWRRSPSPRPTPRPLAPFVDLIADEVNVKDVELTDDVAAVAALRCCRSCPRRSARASAPTSSRSSGRSRPATGPRGRHASSPAASSSRDGEYTLRLVADDDGGQRRAPGDDGVVVLDTDVTPELAAEGLARDLDPPGPAGPPRRRAARQRPHRACAVGLPDPVRRQLAPHAGLDRRRDPRRPRRVEVRRPTAPRSAWVTVRATSGSSGVASA